MKTNHALLILFLATAMVGGCKKDEAEDPVTPTTPVTPEETVFEELIADNIANATETFVLNAGAGGQIFASQGTRLNFGPGTFRHADGTAVTGQVAVSVVEVLSVGNMISLNKQTVGNDNGTLRMLRSGGAINITASQGGEALQLAEGGLVVQIPTTVGDPEMDLFTGTEDEDGTMIWNPVPGAAVVVEPVYIDLYYSFPTNSLNWINCDYFYSYPQLTHITSVLPDGQSTDSTQVWLAFPSQNAVVQMPHSTGQNYVTPPSYAGVPVGLEAVVVGLQLTSTGYFSSFTTVTITPNMTVPMTFTPTTLAAFTAAVNAL